MQLDTKAAAVGRWRGILAHYGLTEQQLSGKHTACPVCGGKDRFRFDDKDGQGTYYCNGCGPGDGFSLVMKLRNCTFGQALREVAALVGQVSVTGKESRQSPEQARAYLRAIMAAATREVISPYLANRGITVAPDVWYHPTLPYYDGNRTMHPAMLGVFKDVNGESIAIHRTYLTADGCKAALGSPKKWTTPIRPLAGSAIRLFPSGECLGIAEGIETACAAFQMFGVPTWAAGSAGILKEFVVPAGVEKVIIFADNDANFVGQHAAYDLATRLYGDGFDVEVKMPDRVGTDWADCLELM